MINQDRVLIDNDGRSTLDLIADFAMKERHNAGAGLIWGFLISVFLWLILGSVFAVLL
jgi:hypothetical protein